jgi:hypothetical protein
LLLASACAADVVDPLPLTEPASTQVSHKQPDLHLRSVLVAVQAVPKYAFYNTILIFNINYF